MATNMEDKKILALAKHLDVEIEDINNGYDDTIFTTLGKMEYRVLTEDERDSAVTDYIKDSLWAFNASFLSSATEIDETVFEKLSELCEGANDGILSIIEKTCGLESFVEDAVNADGHGHFLSPYDGGEDEVYVDGEALFIYRIN